MTAERTADRDRDPAQEGAPGEEPAHQDGDEKTERLVVVVDLRRIPEELLVDEEKPQEVGVRPLHEDDPGEDDREEERQSREGDGLRDLPVSPREDEPEHEDRGGEDDPDEPLGEKTSQSTRTA